MAASANRSNKSRGPAPPRNARRYNVTAAAPNGARPTDPPRNMRRYEAPNGAMAAAVVPYQRDPRQNLMRQIPFEHRVLTRLKRERIMRQVQREFQYSRDDELYRQSIFVLLIVFNKALNEYYRRTRFSWSMTENESKRLEWEHMTPDEMDEAIQIFFHKHPGNPIDTDAVFDTLVGEYALKFFQREDYQRYKTYFDSLNFDEKTEMLNDIKNILTIYKNTLAQQEISLNGRKTRLNERITGGKKSRRKRRR